MAYRTLPVIYNATERRYPVAFKAKLEDGSEVIIEDKVGEIVFDTDGNSYKNDVAGDWIVPCDPPVPAVESPQEVDPDAVDPVSGQGGIDEETLPDGQQTSSWGGPTIGGNSAA